MVMETSCTLMESRTVFGIFSVLFTKVTVVKLLSFLNIVF